MQQEIDPNTFTQKDLLQASQHAVTREEMTAQFRQTEQQNKERFDQVDRRFEQVDKRFEKIDKQLERQYQATMNIHQEIRNQMRWNIGMLIGVGSLIVGILKFTGT